jgi:putative (di)nucleoside polyphosphate hydrolase
VPDSLSFRPNVAALVTNRDGLLLICERWSVRGAWQFPQGGVDPGEDLEEALHREVKEEIGLQPRDYKVIERKGGYRYLYPPEVRWRKLRKHGNHGQEQTYFLCRIENGAPEIDVDQDKPEFRDHRWIRPEEFQLGWLPKFKHKVYQQVMRDFFSVEI